MSHIQLVQAATDLLADSTNPTVWLYRYDAALADDGDSKLRTLVRSLLNDIRSQSSPQGMAA